MRADIQGLRALAVLAVVAYHADRWFDGGFVGVDVFFVISGFVITASILRRRDSAGKVSIVDFYRRRALRILPALFVFLIGSAPIVLMGPSSVIDAASKTAASATVFVANLQLVASGGSGYFSSGAELNPYLHLWSLSVEEQFYFGFPLLVAIGLWLSRRSSSQTMRPVIGLTWLALGASILMMLVTLGLGKDDAAFYLSPVRAWEFLAGALLAMYAPRRHSAGASTSLRVVGLAAIGGTMVIAVPGMWPGLLTFVTVAGTAAVIAAGDDSGHGRWLLANSPMRFIGDVSYSWYLWHWPFVVAASTLAPGLGWFDDIAALVAIVPAWLSLRFVEEPIRRGPLPAVKPLALRSLAGAAVTALAMLVVLPAVNDRLPGNPAEMNRIASVADIIKLNSCPSGAPEGASDPMCGSSAPAAETAVLVGDSFAAQFAAPFRTAADAAGMTPVVRSRTACPYLPGVTMRGPATRPKKCDAHNLALREYLLTVRPSLVVISADLKLAIDDPLFRLEVNDSGEITDPEIRMAVVETSLRTAVDELTRGGTEVVLLRGTPSIGEFSLVACSRVRNLIDTDGCGTESTMAAALALRASADAVIDRVADEFALTVTDYDEQLCPVRCDSHDDRGWLYVDGSHVTGTFALTLTPLFAAMFDDAAPGTGDKPTPAPNDHPDTDGPDTNRTDTDGDDATNDGDTLIPTVPSPDASDTPKTTVSVPSLDLPPVSLPVTIPETTVSVPSPELPPLPLPPVTIPETTLP